MPRDSNLTDVFAAGASYFGVADLEELAKAKILGVRSGTEHRYTGDPSDVLQEAFLDISRRFPEYAGTANVPFFLWLRGLTGQRLIDLHRQHLGAKMPLMGAVFFGNKKPQPSIRQFFAERYIAFLHVRPVSINPVLRATYYLPPWKHAGSD